MKTWNLQQSIPSNSQQYILSTIHIINNQYDFILGNYNKVQQSMPTMQFTRQDHTEMRKRAVIKRRIPRNVEIGVASKWQCEGRKPFSPRTLKAAKVGAKTGRKWDRASGPRPLCGVWQTDPNHTFEVTSRNLDSWLRKNRSVYELWFQILEVFEICPSVSHLENLF